jgi:hypothetical protein
MLGLGALLLLDVDALRDAQSPLASRVRAFARDALRDLGDLLP